MRGLPGQQPGVLLCRDRAVGDQAARDSRALVTMSASVGFSWGHCEDWETEKGCGQVWKV